MVSRRVDNCLIALGGRGAEAIGKARVKIDVTSVFGKARCRASRTRKCLPMMNRHGGLGRASGAPVLKAAGPGHPFSGLCPGRPAVLRVCPAGSTPGRSATPYWAAR